MSERRAGPRWTYDNHARRYVRSDGAEVVHSPGYGRPWVAWVGGEPLRRHGSSAVRTWAEPSKAMQAIEGEFPLEDGDSTRDLSPAPPRPALNPTPEGTPA